MKKQKILDYSIQSEKHFQEELEKIKQSNAIKLREASNYYRQELEQLKSNAQFELNKIRHDSDTRMNVERVRVENAEKQAEIWRFRAGEAEKARSMLTVQMNDLMQTRCAEAIKVNFR